MRTLTESLLYGSYAVAALVALAVYVGLAKDGRSPRQGVVFLLMAAAIGGLILLVSRMAGAAGSGVWFYILALLIIGGGIRVVTHPRPVYSALYFVLVVLSTAAMIVLAGAEFLGAALVIVYAGAILVTYVFVIMLSQQSFPTSTHRFTIALDYDHSAREPKWAAMAGFMLMATLAGMIVQRDWPAMVATGGKEMAEPNTLALGKVLMLDYAVSVELAGVLLMVALIGAIALARKPIPQPDRGEAIAPPGEIGRHVKPF